MNVDSQQSVVKNDLDTIKRYVIETRALIERLTSHVDAGSSPRPAMASYLSARQAAERLGCSTRTIDRAVDKGLLKAYRFGNGSKRKHRRFRVRDLEEFAEQRGP